MATPFTIDDFRSITEIRKGFLNGVFTYPSLIVNHFHRVFCDGNVTLSDETENSFVITCESYDYCKTQYKRMFHIIFETREDNTKRIINIEEL